MVLQPSGLPVLQKTTSSTPLASSLKFRPSFCASNVLIRVAIGIGFLLSLAQCANALIVLTETNETIPDRLAGFGPSIPTGGIEGALLPIQNISPFNGTLPFVWMALVLRGNCSFTQKVRSMQLSGASAVIVGDIIPFGGLVTMSRSGDFIDITIPSVFITHEYYGVLQERASQQSKNTVKESTNRTKDLSKDKRLFYIRDGLMVRLEPNSSLFPLLEMIIVTVLSPVLVIFGLWCIWVYNEITRRWRDLAPSSLVKSLPLSVVSDETTMDIPCTICLDNYEVGSIIRSLPCRHKFHAECVDRWLILYLKVCPLCKADVTNSPEATETTPLLMTQV